MDPRMITTRTLVPRIRFPVLFVQTAGSVNDFMILLEYKSAWFKSAQFSQPGLSLDIKHVH